MKHRAELFMYRVSMSDYICTVALHDKQERRKLVSTLEQNGFTCKLAAITHNDTYRTFNYIVSRRGVLK